MFKYLLKRILFFLPTIWIISLLTFSLSVNSPGDPVELMLNVAGESGQNADKQAQQFEYDKMREKLHLNLPVFYCTVSSLAEPDTLYKVKKKLHRDNLSRLLDKHGDWQAVSDYYYTIQSLDYEFGALRVEDTLKDKLIELRQNVNELYFKYDDQIIINRIAKIVQGSLLIHHGEESAILLKKNYEHLRNREVTWASYVPSVNWYGTNNQYHIWLSNLLHGDLGVSYFQKLPVIEVIQNRIMPTVVYSVLSILIAFIISIPLGINSAVNLNSRKDKVTTITLFVLYSLPSFWVGTLLINYFTSPEYLDWFPSTGIKDFDDSASFFDKLGNYMHHMALPLFCYTYSSFAFISRQMRGSMIQTLNQDYIRTAWAKGLLDKQVYWKHALRNSLLPIITLLASVFPALIAGSVVIEHLFTLPGMGLLAYESVVTKDFPVIYVIMLFSAILTLIGYLVADILYAIVDPRISYSKK